ASDLAENNYSDEQLSPGDIVVSLGGINVGRSAQMGDTRLLGVVSTKPGIILGLDNDNEGKNLYPIALAGRVPVNINLQGGPIEIGDPITLSSELGVGMKATTTARIVGYALEAFDGSSTTQKQMLLFAKTGQWTAPADSLQGLLQPTAVGFAMTGSSSLLAQAVTAVKEWLASMGVVIERSILKVKEIVVDMLTAKKVAVDQLQMKDKFTGEVYCVELVNGDLVRTKGECAAPNTTVNSVPRPDESPFNESNVQGSPSINSGTTIATSTTEAATSTTEISPIGPIDDSATTTETATTTDIGPIGQISPIGLIDDSATSTTEVATTTPAGGE
ncbi:MAG: hypothetical protein HYW56_00135, partial [Candidatus Harrisonbacteria bacterium]|nr:hypothetical protein [Candidatus Harrisonbacteria bacterium]